MAGASSTTDAAGAYSLPVIFDMPVTVSVEGTTSPLLVATAEAPQTIHDVALDNVPARLVYLWVNGVLQPTCAGYPDYCSVQVADASGPISFSGWSVDADGDPISYMWSGNCDGTGGSVALGCEPPDASTTYCDPPDATCSQGRYYVTLDDGLVGVDRTIFLSQAP